MEEEEVQALVKQAFGVLRLSFVLVLIVVLAMVYSMLSPEAVSPAVETDSLAVIPNEEDRDRIEDGIHLRTGLIDAEGMFVVVANCTNCHSAKLVTQNRMTAERWNETIKWMQETQGLWDLGENQDVIVKYLVKNYPPGKSNGRRSILTNIEWYESKN